MKFEPSNREYELAPAGTTVATLYGVVDLGTQEREDPNTKEIKREPKVRLTWELPNDLMADGRPFSISEEYTVSAHEKANIVKLFKAWLGITIDQDFRLQDQIGKSGMMNVTHNISKKNGNIYANVGGMSPLMKGLPQPERVNSMIFFDLDHFDGKNEDVLNALPSYSQEKIRKSPEYMEAKQGRPVTQPASDGYENMPDYRA